MKTQHILVIATFVAALNAQAAGAAGVGGYGASASDTASAEQVIEIRPGMHNVNVVNGQTVRFKSGDASFTWHVLTAPNVNAFDLKDIAPANFSASGIRVYVADSAQYHNS